jgi:DNA-binding GntR family transcriptional regulator
MAVANQSQPGEPALPVTKRKDPASPRSAGRATPVRGRPAADQVYASLRDDIVTMRVAPGQPLNEKRLALAHGVSRTPVREALLRLAGEQLVDIFPQSGTFVGRIPITALPEAILVRKALEDLTVREAAKNVTPARLDALRASIAEQQALADRDDRERFHEADEAFHAAVAEAAGHPAVWRLVLQVKVQVDRYRRLTLPMAGRMDRIVAEHAAVVDAIAAHDSAQAAAAIAKHLNGLSDSIGDIRDLNPDFFDLPPDWPKT